MRWIKKTALAILLCTTTASGFDPASGDYLRDNPLHIRLLSYNTQRNFISTPANDDAFNRILVAIDPDVIVFQEIQLNVAASTIITRLNSVLPLPSGSWEVQMGLSGGIRNVLASRYPLADALADTIPSSATRGVTIARIDLPDAIYVDDIYILGVHLKAFSGASEDALRQQSVDAIANWLGDARGVPRASGENISLATDTRMIVVGDFNLVGPSAQPELTLINGDIQNEGVYGTDVKGDWDNTDMTELMPTDPFTGDTDTWPSSATNPSSRLDRFVYSDSSSLIVNSFILNTLNMTGVALSGTGLLASDTTPSSTANHTPIVMDLQIVQDCNNNSIPDDIETASGTAADCNSNTIPDECESTADCNSNGTIDFCDIVSGNSLDCNNNVVPDECESQSDCNLNGTQDICDIAGGTSLDCNNNGIPDTCDLESGNADDCNTNAVPDSCEPNNDCNFNSIQDICDIAAGTSIDCDGNEIIDLCELDGFVDSSLFASDFVNQFPPAGWSATGLWHGTNQCPRLNECDPPRWAYFGRSGLCNFDSGLTETGTMSAPQVTIPADAVSATLTYCSAYNGEGGNANVSGFDWAYVTVNGTKVDDAGVDGIQNEWEVRSVDLSAFAGQTVDIEWRFDSRDSSGNTGLGWQVDQAELIASIPVDRDCNENGTLDACEITAGSGTDCDLDGLLDQCGPDCDSNGTPDVCDAIALLPNQPQTQEQCVGETAVFTVTAPSPSATLQWFKLATPLVDGGTISGATSNELTITNVQLADGGSYRCVITDGCVVANSDLASLSIATIPVSILLQPELQISRCAGEEAEFTVFVDGSFPHTFEWRRDGLPFGAPDSPTLTLSNLTTDDTGDYTCFASNACGGELSIIGQLSVGGGLFFQHPSDQCAEQGETITMTAGATGSGFLWAWSKDDVGIFNGGQFSGATSDTLMITNVTAANAGVYKAFAFNNSPLCLNVSEPATLSIGGCAGCPIPGDLDADGDVDLADARNFTDCFGSDVQSSPECVCANIDDTNSAIDLADWASFAPLLTGP